MASISVVRSRLLIVLGVSSLVAGCSGSDPATIEPTTLPPQTQAISSTSPTTSPDTTATATVTPPQTDATGTSTDSTAAAPTTVASTTTTTSTTTITTTPAAPVPPPVDLAGAPLVRPDPGTPDDALAGELDRVAAAIFVGDDTLGVDAAPRISPTGLEGGRQLSTVADLQGDACTDFIVAREGLARYSCVLTDGTNEARVGFALNPTGDSVSLVFAGGSQPGFDVDDQQRADGQALITEITTAWIEDRLDDVADLLPQQTLDILRSEPAPAGGQIEITPDCPSPDLAYGAGTDAECAYFVAGTPSATVLADMRLTDAGWTILLIDPFLS